MGTIYQCLKRGPDVNKSLILKHEADTQKEAVEWLEKNGGGVYRNILHNLQYEVKPCPINKNNEVSYEIPRKT